MQHLEIKVFLPPEKFAKVMFSQVSVCPWGWGVCMAGGACMAGGGVHGRGHALQGEACIAGGACMAGGMHGRGVCVACPTGRY